MIGTLLATQAGVWGMLTDVSDDIVFDKLGNFQSVAVVLAAMLAAYTVLKNSADYINGESKFLWPMIRPILMLICIMDFPLVCGALDSVVNIFTREIASNADSNFKDLGAAMENVYTELGSYALEQGRLADRLAEEEQWSFWKKLKEGISLAASTYFKSRQMNTLTLLTFIGRLIAESIFWVYETLAALFLGLLKILGPVVFAIAIPEGLKQGLLGWVSRYVQISLWVPIGYIIIMFLTAFFQVICMSVINAGYASGVFVVGIGLIIAIVAATMGIPKIASWVIQSSGSANAQSGLERTATRMLSRLGR